MSQKTDPAVQGIAFTPHDTNLINPATRGLLIATAGPVAVQFVAGTTVVIPLLVAGIIHPLSVVRVMDTGTTETSVILFW
jgi:hypothetical protein